MKELDGNLGMDPHETRRNARDTDLPDHTQEQQHAETAAVLTHTMVECEVVRLIRKCAEVAASWDISNQSVAANQRHDPISESHGKQSVHSTSTSMNPVTAMTKTPSI